MGILPNVSRSCGSSCFATGDPNSELGGDWFPCDSTNKERVNSFYKASGWRWPGRTIRISASTLRAASFHFGCGDAAEEVNFSCIGFVISVSEKRFEDEGDKRLAYEGDLGPDIWVECGGDGVC